MIFTGSSIVLTLGKCTRMCHSNVMAILMQPLMYYNDEIVGVDRKEKSSYPRRRLTLTLNFKTLWLYRTQGSAY